MYKSKIAYDEEKQNEIDALKSIYYEEFEEDPTDPSSFRIRIDSDLNEAKETLFLRIKHTKNYPDEAPNYSIETDTDIDTNLTQDEIEEMNTKMEEIIQDNMGMAMIFSMASSLKESLDELLIKKLEEAETVEKERIDKEIELEQKKFVGTKVTRQVFMEWKKRFELEQATENKLSELDIKKLESKKQRLTGNNNIS
ncbi:hypothetical protein BB559_003486 [Furculomyces boomerangus]|uniref:RWD domain-containing protein n=1 Tax=Furculomyces boomerangus TaxID=61424 RepID=A0A2T9YL01_9FUNG|nr:hypothetical protein BB559_003486 [Furculomyces boomerangus]